MARRGINGTIQQEPFQPNEVPSGPSTGTAIPGWNEKIKNAIVFFAFEHEKGARELLTVTTLHEYLAFFEYGSSEEAECPALESQAFGMSRTPGEPCSGQATYTGDSFLLIPQKGTYVVKATGKPDLSRFSPFELKEMTSLVKAKVAPLAGVSHERHDPREETWAEIKKAVMDASELSFFTKPKEVDKMSGLTLLTEKYTTQIQELENKMAEIKRKLETIAEASRLLEEEGLSEEEARPRWP
jgi:hypothetical protein